MATYYVSQKAKHHGSGNEESPFLTIQEAADIASVGDRIIVKEGVYREWVSPENGGLTASDRIIYQAAEGEKVVIKGSEVITGFERVEGSVWKKVIPNTFFGEYNPYKQEITGDWLVGPYDKKIHTGEVYMNGRSFFEVLSYEEVCHPQERIESPYIVRDRKELIDHPEQTKYCWYVETDEENTTLYVNFQQDDPTENLIEINVRKCCFYPKKSGINYITVRGFEIEQAATPWAPATADQIGIIGANWSKGWIIENNHIHDSKCIGVSLGKNESTGHNECSRWHRKPGYQYQMEGIYRGLENGWSKEKIGSHHVQNNKIHDCGQNGIAGNMGCAFSSIIHNEIYNIGIKHEFYGHELAGIKFHTAIDVLIKNNYIHNCTLGTWLDWEAQGTRVTANIYDKNNRDMMIEVTHGPHLVDNNVFTSDYGLDNAAQGGAYVHNIWCGLMYRYPVLHRPTPYHFPHSTKVMGTANTYGADDRWYQNIFIGGPDTKHIYGTADYKNNSQSLEEYIAQVESYGEGDIENFLKVQQPVYIDCNVYLNGAAPFAGEKQNVINVQNPNLRLDEIDGELWLQLELPDDIITMETTRMDSQKLGTPRITEERFENPDGSDLVIDRDLLNNNINEKPIPGPIQLLHGGKNRVKIWKY